MTTNLRFFFLKFGDCSPTKRGMCNLFFLDIWAKFGSKRKRLWVPTKFFSSLGKHLIMQNKLIRVWFTLRSRFLLYVIWSSDTAWWRVWKVAGCKFIKYLSPAIKLEGRQVIRVKWCCDCYPHCTGHCTSQQSSVGSSHSFSLTWIWV